MKKVITILFVTLVFTCVAIYAFRLREQEQNLTVQKGTVNDETTDGKTVDDEAEKATISQEGLGPNDYRFVVDASQLRSMEELCISYNGMGDLEGDTYQFQITSARKSRTLREDFKEGR